jgi:prepilin-type N-terminal cleavage/methylation domain-containing protein
MRSRRASSNVLHRSGFSLIELLVVIGIIALLASSLGVAITRVQQSSRRAKAKVQIKQLEKAIQAYRDDCYPIVLSPGNVEWWPELSVPFDAEGMKVLDVAAKTLAGSNSLEQVYFDITDTMIRVDEDGDSGFVDPWNRCYKFLCDYDDVGTLDIPFANSLGSMIVLEGVGVAVWSEGPDGDDALTKDNITSWKTQ